MISVAMPLDLDDVRGALLRLHKALLDAQRVEYEREHGRVDSRGELLRLVLQHPSFEWLRALSALIAQLDELSEIQDEDVSAQVTALVDTLRALVRFEGDPAFTQRYRKFIDEVPDALVAHVQLSRMLNSPDPG
jgi:hypothetical protein